MQNIWMNNYQTTLTAELASSAISLAGLLAESEVETMLVNAGGDYQVWLTLVSPDNSLKEVVLWDGTTLTRKADRISTDWIGSVGPFDFPAGSKVYCDMPQVVLANLENAVASLPKFDWQNELTLINGRVDLSPQGAYRLNMGGLYLPITVPASTLDWCLIDASAGTESYSFFDDQNGPPSGLIQSDGSPWTWTFSEQSPGVIVQGVPLMRYGPASLFVVTQAIALPDTLLYL